MRAVTKLALGLMGERAFAEAVEIADLGRRAYRALNALAWRGDLTVESVVDGRTTDAIADGADGVSFMVRFDAGRVDPARAEKDVVRALAKARADGAEVYATTLEEDPEEGVVVVRYGKRGNI